MKRFYVYILQSPSSGDFYIGQTENLDDRLLQHNDHYFKMAHTKSANDWKVMLSIYPKPVEIKKNKVKFPFYFTKGIF